jgi:hypothetical protein
VIDESIILIAKEIAPRHGLDPALVCAVIEQESSGNTWAIRWEAAFYVKYILKLGLESTEGTARAISWGLMQVMGEVARENGWTGPLPALCDPNTGIEIGCKVLAAKRATAARMEAGETITPGPGMTVAQAFAMIIDSKTLELWNGGGNLNYVAEVLARVKAYS